MPITKLSHSPWASVDSDWVIDVINMNKGNATWNSWMNSPSKYSNIVRSIVSSVIPQIWEEITAKYIGGDVFLGKTHDITLSDGRRVENKTARVGSSASIRQRQLELYWEDDIYALLYYEMRNNSYPPSYYVQRAISEDYPIWPQAWLKKNIRWRSLFLIQRPSIVHFFNTSNLRLFRNSSWQPYKSLSRRSAQRIFDENPDWFEAKRDKHLYWSHKIDVFRLWNNI